MNTIRFIDLLANVGELRGKFEKAFQAVGIKVNCVLTSTLKSQEIHVYKEQDDRTPSKEITALKSDQIPTFDFLLAGFPYQSEIPIRRLFIEMERILQDKKPYGFIIENIEGLIHQEGSKPKDNISEQLYVIIDGLKRIGYKLSWRLLENQTMNVTESSQKVFIVGTLGSKDVLSDTKSVNFNGSENHHHFLKWFFEQEDDDDFSDINIDSSKEMTNVQKQLLGMLLEGNRKKEKIADEQPTVKEKPLTSYMNKEKEETEKEVYFKLYPPKKLVEITKEDGSVTGLVHSFIFQEVFEETVKELDFTRNLNSDLEALFTSSGEQILVIDPKGKIIRVSGNFFHQFWQVNDSNQMIGRQINEFVEQGVFQPNIFNLCMKKQDKVTAIQESGKRRIWSVATPVYVGEELEKVIVLSREITSEEPTVYSKSTTNSETKDTLSVPVYEDKRLIYRSEKIENIITQLKRAAKMNSTILIQGETGVGKEIFAHKIHKNSMRHDFPFIRINCGAIPEQLIESELFGYEKGSFTGADQKGKIGYFELAHQGTIFLDEIGELPLNMQVKLLRVLQEKEIMRIGGTRPISIDVRIIAATNRNLKKLVEQGKFREDLYYRLNVIPFKIPALRNRKQDVLPLAVYFLEKQKKLYDIDKSFTPEAIEVLETYDWPGNIRELQNIIERLLIFNDEEWIKREHVLITLYGEEEAAKKDIAVFRLMPLKEAVEMVEAQLIKLGMEKYPTAAELAKVLEVSPATLSRRMKEHNMKE